MRKKVIQLASAWQLVAKRSLAHWRILSTVVLGVLMAASLMAATVVYFDALRELALRRTIAERSSEDLDINMRTVQGPVTRTGYEKVASIIRDRVDHRIGWVVSESFRLGKSRTFFLTDPGDESEAGNDNRRATFAFLDDMNEHVTVLPGGSFPSQTLVETDRIPEIKAMIPLDVARTFNVGVGDRMVAVPFWNDDVPYVTVAISGVFQRKRPTEDYWRLNDDIVKLPEPSTLLMMPFYVSEEAFLDVLGPLFRRTDGTYAWLLITDPGKVHARNADDTLVSITSLQRELAATLSVFSMGTSLDDVIREFSARFFFSQVPMSIVLVMVVMVVLYYVATLSSLAIEERRTEVALLRSRGASPTQILAVFVLEGVTIAALCVVVAPLFAVEAVSILGITPIFSDLTDGTRLTATLSPAAYAMSATGGLLSLVALIAPAVQASRIDLTRQRRESARPTTRPAFQRYYLDVLLLVVSVFLFRQLSEQGSVLASSLFGDVAASKMLLALPALVLVALAMVLLRIFPLVMRLVSRVTSPLLPVGLVLGLWQIARQPAHYARLALLLILTAGLGLVASSFGATLERSFVERVLFSTGSDFRVNGIAERYRSNPSRLVNDYEREPGVLRASPVMRSLGQDASETYGERFILMAVDVDSFADVGWFRDDFTDSPIVELLRELRVAKSSEGIELPYDATSVTVTLKTDRPHPTVSLFIRFRERGSVKTSRILLGDLGKSGWTEMRADVPRDGPGLFSLRPPLILMTFGIEETSGAEFPIGGSVTFDSIEATTESGRTVVIETFQDISGWRSLKPLPDGVTDFVRASDQSVGGDEYSLVLNWKAGAPRSGRGMLFTGSPADATLPILASKSFIRASGHRMDEEFMVSIGGAEKRVKLVGAVNMFPTISDPKAKFVVVDLYSIDRIVNVEALGSVSDFPTLDRFSRFYDLGTILTQSTPTELWLSVSTTAPQLRLLRQRLSEQTSIGFVDRATRLEESKIDPLLEAGWSALLFIAFLVVLVLSCMGLAAHTYASFRTRRTQMALLRSVGLSTRQFISMVWVELMAIVGMGLTVGAWMGGIIGATIMPFLEHDEFGNRVMPPFVLEINWAALATTYALMMLLITVIISALILLIRRISLHTTLRRGED